MGEWEISTAEPGMTRRLMVLLVGDRRVGGWVGGGGG